MHFWRGSGRFTTYSGQRPLKDMHRTQLRQIVRDAEVAYAIQPIVRKHLLTVEQTADALRASGVERAGNVARIAMTHGGLGS